MPAITHYHTLETTSCDHRGGRLIRERQQCRLCGMRVETTLTYRGLGAAIIATKLTTLPRYLRLHLPR